MGRKYVCTWTPPHKWQETLVKDIVSIEEQVNDRSHALKMRSTPMTDRRNEKSESMLAQ